MTEADPAAESLFASRFALGQRLSEVQVRKQKLQGVVFMNEMALMRLEEPGAASADLADGARHHVADARDAIVAVETEIMALEAEIAAVDRAIAGQRSASRKG